MSDADLPEFYLQPCEVRLVRIPAILKTVLGSCVGITFRAPRLGLGAMCHPMLPSCGPSRIRAGAMGPTRYVDCAILEVLQQFDRLGALRSEVEVKVFGGADVLPTVRKDATVGTLNCETAMRVLEEQGLPVRASRLGGIHGIFIAFHTGTGEVLLRPLDRMRASPLGSLRVFPDTGIDEGSRKL